MDDTGSLEHRAKLAEERIAAKAKIVQETSIAEPKELENQPVSTLHSPKTWDPEANMPPAFTVFGVQHIVNGVVTGTALYSHAWKAKKVMDVLNNGYAHIEDSPEYKATGRNDKHEAKMINYPVF